MTKLETYLARFQGIKAKKVAADLKRSQGVNRIYRPRHEQAEIMALGSYVQIDRNRGRVYLDNGRFFEIAALTKTMVDYLEWLIYDRHFEKAEA